MRLAARVAAGILCGTLVIASCDTFTTELEPDPDSVEPSEILALTRTGGTAPLPADGISEDTIVAAIPKDASLRVVTFTTTAGSFLPITGAKQIDVRAEPGDGAYADRLVAKAVLRADTAAVTAVVTAKVGEFTRYLEVRFID